MFRVSTQSCLFDFEMAIKKIIDGGNRVDCIFIRILVNWIPDCEIRTEDDFHRKTGPIASMVSVHNGFEQYCDTDEQRTDEQM